MVGNIRRYLAAALAMIAALAMMGGLALRASAAGLSSASPDLYLEYSHEDAEKYPLGVMATLEDGSNVYCVELDMDLELDFDTAQPVEDSDKVRRIAWLINKYRKEGTALDHAAIAALVHEHLDETENWPAHYESAKKSIEGLETRVNELWQEAVEHTPKKLKATKTYVQGELTGVVTIEVLNSEDKRIAGVPYTVELTGPATFDENSEATISGTSDEEAIDHAWTAAGNGEVTVNTSYDIDTLTKLVGKGQDFVRYGGQDTVRDTGVTFKVTRRLGLSLSTQVDSKVVAPGQPVIDQVSIGTLAEGDVWPKGGELIADGYYFTDLTADQLTGAINPEQGEGVQEFLARLAGQGHEPDAYGSAVFEAPGQTIAVTAMTERDGSTPYLPDETGAFGTWVWGIEADRQGEAMRGLLDGDWVSGFLEPEETNVEQALPYYASKVDDAEVTVGEEIADTIEISKLPDDHGEFDGSESYGFEADEPQVQVELWWTGDPDDSSEDDAWTPEGEEPPSEEDEHHQLVGTWDYQAVNGRIRVGGGAEDAHGDPVRIVAERRGWYVFVLRFAGDDRAVSGFSPYDDPNERVRVREADEELPPEDPTDPQEPRTPENPSVPSVPVTTTPNQPTSTVQTPTANKRLATTGADITVAFIVALSAAAVAAFMLAVIRRRKL